MARRRQRQRPSRNDVQPCPNRYGASYKFIVSVTLLEPPSTAIPWAIERSVTRNPAQPFRGLLYEFFRVNCRPVELP